MRHVPDGVLRRLDDEPLAVPDRVIDHVTRCGRCSARRAEIAHDTELTARMFSAPHLVADTDTAWAQVRRELLRTPSQGAYRRGRATASLRRAPRFPRPSLRAAALVGAVAVLVGGTAAAATLTNVFAPTHVAAVSVRQGELRAVASFMGLGNSQTLGGFSTPDGSTRFRFGTVTWSSGSATPAWSLASATQQAGFRLSLPAHPPAGVGPVHQFIVQPRVKATVSFNSLAAGIAGSSVTITAGPAVVAEYAGTSGNDLPTLGVAAMPRPTAVSAGATITQIEAFLLDQPGIPPALAEEVRLLGDLRTTLPVPVPAGASVRSVDIAGWPGVLLADASKAAAAVVWEDGRGMLHLVAGLLDPQDVLNVAHQLG